MKLVALVKENDWPLDGDGPIKGVYLNDEGYYQVGDTKLFGRASKRLNIDTLEKCLTRFNLTVVEEA